MMSLVRSIRRRSNQREVAGSLLAQCWDTPVARGKDDWREAKFLACDTELSALDPKSGEVLSIGWVPIDGRQVLLNQGEHHLLKPQQTVGQSATIHQLRDCELLDAADPKAILEIFLNAAAGRILVFHHAELDMAFLNRLSERYFGSPLLLPCLDTLLMEKTYCSVATSPSKKAKCAWVPAAPGIIYPPSPTTMR